MTKSATLKGIGILISLLLLWIPLGFMNGKLIATILLGIIAIGEFIK